MEYDAIHGRRDKLVKEKRHDPYVDKQKRPEPSVCSTCGVGFEDGRWTWKKMPENANKTICPACQRIADKYPAGYIEIRGEFFKTHKSELMNLIRNQEELEKAEHPMERIIDILDKQDHTVVTTTGIHVARRIGEALSSAYQGDFSVQYGDESKTVRVLWSR